MGSTTASVVHDQVGDEATNQPAYSEDGGDKRESNLGHRYTCGRCRYINTRSTRSIILACEDGMNLI